MHFLKAFPKRKAFLLADAFTNSIEKAPFKANGYFKTIPGNADITFCFLKKRT
jgi:hypothetical protein